MQNTPRVPRVIAAICMGASLVAGYAQTVPAPPAPTAPVVTAPRPVSEKLVGDYTGWAGSRQNAEALVQGLRTGSPVTLGGASGTTFTPSTTTKLGTGEVNIALSLAKTSLAQQGITQPTPAQIAAALNGGTVTTAKGTQTLSGVLTQRQSGMGWGQIANAMGVKLGSVVSASKSGKGTTGMQYAKAKLHDKAGSAGTHGKGDHGGGGSSGGGGGGGGGGGKK
jgi:hypothetical protein